MPKGNSTSANILKIIYQAVAWAKIAQNNGTTPATGIVVALHKGAVTATGTQATNVANYTNYVNRTINRNATGWPVTNQTVNPGANIDFAEAGTTTGQVISYFSVGYGTGIILHCGTVTPNITIAAGVIPRLTTASAITEG